MTEEKAGEEVEGRKAENIRTKEAQQDQRDTQYYIPTRKPKEDQKHPHPLLEKKISLVGQSNTCLSRQYISSA